MGLLNLFFDFNSQLWTAIMLSLLFIGIVLLDKFLWGLIPNFIVGLFGLVALGSWIYYFGKNFILNLWNTNIGKGVILAVVFILLALILTTSFSKQKTVITETIQIANPSKIGKNIKKIGR